MPLGSVTRSNAMKVTQLHNRNLTLSKNISAALGLQIKNLFAAESLG